MSSDNQPQSFNTILIVIASIIIVFVSVLAIVLYYGPNLSVRGSGDLVTEQKDFTDFSEIEIASGFQAIITQSSNYQVSITADDNIIDNIEVSKNGETLEIRLKRGSYGSYTLRTEISIPDLHRVEFSGGTRGSVKGFNDAHDFILDLSGGSRIEMEGESDNIMLDASGGSQAELSNFNVNDADIELSGGSQATINIDGMLDANLSGGSKLYYVGEPTLGDIDTSGGSSINRR